MKPAKLAATRSESTTGQLRDSGLVAPSIELASSPASAPISPASRSRGERATPNPRPVWTSESSVAIACRNE